MNLTGWRISEAAPVSLALPGSVAAMPCGGSALGVGLLGVPGARVTGRVESKVASRVMRAVDRGMLPTGFSVRTARSSGETDQL